MAKIGGQNMWEVTLIII